MKWKTAISTIKNNQTIIRDKLLVDMAKNKSFVSNIYFILTGKEATPEIEKMLNVLFSVSIDHGLGVVSTLNARMATSAGSSVQQALIASLASMTKTHGGATKEAAIFFTEHVLNKNQTSEIVKQQINENKKIPGYGHSVLKEDERTELLFKEVKELNLFGQHCKFAKDIEEAMYKEKGKRIALNIDGAIAAVALDIGLSADIAIGLFIISRIPGLVAHIEEERSQKNKLRRVPEDSEDIEYLGCIQKH